MSDLLPRIPPAAARREWRLISLLFALMLLKGALWSLVFPLWQGPDEDDHYAVIQFIGETGRLPDAGDEILPDEVTLSRQLADVGRLPYAPEQRQGFTGGPLGPNEPVFDALDPAVRRSFDLGGVGKLMHATPLYYALAAPIYRLTAGGSLLWRVQMQRLFAVLVGSPVVIAAYLISRQLFPWDPNMRLTIPFLVAFQPMMTEITAVVSVDGLLILCYSLLIFLTIDLLRRGLNGWNAAAIGVVFAVGVLTKPTLNGYAPIIALAVLVDWWRRPGERWAVVRAAALMNAIILPPLAWWMQRSWRLNQDLFYFNPILKGHRIIENPLFDYAPLQHAVDYYQSVWGGIFVTWWAHFGWLDTPLDPWVYTLLRLLTWLAMAGLVWRLLRRGEERLPGRILLIGAFLGLTMIVPILLLQVYDLTFWWEFGNGRGLQGRYWLGTVIPMLAAFAAGLLIWLPTRWRPAGHHLLRLAMIVLNLASLIGAIIPRYYL